MQLKKGDILKIILPEVETYVIIVEANGGLGFRSFILNFDDQLPINAEVLQKYNWELIGNAEDPEDNILQIDLLAEMTANFHYHQRLWELFDAEGWQEHYDRRRLN